MSALSMVTLRTFSNDEITQVEARLGDLARSLRAVPGGGKIEEDYWTHIYRSVKGAPHTGWSNKPMRDYCHDGLGVEMKLLCRTSPSNDQGRRLMHPAATRTVTYDPNESAEICKVQVLTQFGTQISEFRERVRASCAAPAKPVIRWGIFLWKASLDEFLYFEEDMAEPDPSDYYAEFENGSHRGEPTRNLWIYEKGTDIKRFSVTTPKKGAKVQPYFDVPLVGQGAYLFNVPLAAEKPLWLSEKLREDIHHAAGNQSIEDFLRSFVPTT